MNPEHLSNTLKRHLETIYAGVEGVKSEDCEQLCDELIGLMRVQQANTEPARYINHWDETDCLVISYGDSILQQGEKPLHTLKQFLES